ncbi:tetratricopeptide repeat protein [Roseiflexus sp. RS-1]|uniref:tetratricopeptide repeat protein n=1 Tax=Roseiflexus sp. (strain RS-1) TaxID=357808 RepID=UPI0002ED6EBD|nr:tetratricopeptide repeat protein [Roseiflexus sp. RS-1]
MHVRRFPLYVGVVAIVAVIAFVVANAVQLFSDPLRDWIVQMYNADPLRFIVASILIFAFIAAGAIWIAYQQYRGQQPENADLSGFKEASTIRLLQLPENLSDDLKAREFIPATRQKEQRALTDMILTVPKQSALKAFLHAITFRRLFRPASVPVAVVTGIGGIGKTSLALFTSYDRRIRQAYPGGRFYFDAAGIYPEHASDTTAQVLFRFLVGAGIDNKQINQALGLPASEEDRARQFERLTAQKDDPDVTDFLQRLYVRSLIGKHRLIIIDNPPNTADLSAFEPPEGNALLVITRPEHPLYKLRRMPQLRLKPMDEPESQRIIKKEWPADQTISWNPDSPDGRSVCQRIHRLGSGIPLVVLVLSRMLKNEAEDGGSLEAAVRYLSQLEHDHAAGAWTFSAFLNRLLQLPYSAEPNRATVEEVFRLSYVRLTEDAQRMFRSLAIFSGLHFDERLAVTVGSGTDETFRQLLRSGLVERAPDSQRFYLYDPIALFARTLLHQSPDEPQEVVARYAAFFADLADQTEARFRAASDQAERQAIVSALATEAIHLRRCRDALLESTAEQAPVLLLRLSASVLGIIQHTPGDHDAPPGSSILVETLPTEQAPGLRLRLSISVPGIIQQTPGDRNAHNASLGSSDEWEPVATRALAQIIERLSAQDRALYAGLGIFPGSFDVADARPVLAPIVDTVDDEKLDNLRAMGILRQVEARRYEVRPSIVRAHAQDAFRQMPPDQQQAVGDAFARHYAQKAQQYSEESDVTAQTLFERDWAAISKGQAIALERAPDLDRELVIYANARFSYWYILYDDLLPWLEAGLAAAKRRGDDANKALLLALHRAIVAEHQQQWAEAAQWYRQALDMPGAAPATRARVCLGLGVVAERQQQWEEAAQWYRQALDMPGAAPDTRARACNGLGAVAVEQQQWAEAAQWYRQALDMPGATPDTRARACNGLGYVAAEQQQWAEAARWRRQALDMPGAAPDTRERACHGLGVVAERQQQWVEAAQWYQQALDMPGAASDTRATACHGLGNVAYAQKNVREARQHYSRAIELQPANAIAYRNRGLTWAAENPPDYERALADARRALELDSAYENARRDVERYEQALTAPDTRARACLEQGNVAERQQQWAEAAQWYQKAFDTSGAADTRADACIGLGDVAAAQQQWTKAAEWYAQALAIPDAAPATHAAACLGLGDVAYAQKNVREARQHFSRAIELWPAHAIAYRNRGLTWAAEVPPDYERALADARRALELSPAFDDARRDIERYEQALKQQQLNPAFLYEQALKRALEDARRDVVLNRTLEDARRDVERSEQASKRRNRNRPNRKRNQGR